MTTELFCRSCGSGDLQPILSLGMMPLTDAYVDPGAPGRSEPRYPLDLALCAECSLIQILHTVPPEEMFEDYQYFSSFSDTLLAHSREHARRLVATRGLGPGSLVLEVASNDGYLLRYFLEAGVPVLGIDPAGGPADAAEAAGIPTLREYFGVELAERLIREGRRADVLLANNVLAHVPDLNGFVAGIAAVLGENGIAQIEVPYVKDLIENLEFDTIYHEHLCYFSVTALRPLFARHGLSLNGVQHLEVHGGSLRLTVAREEDGDGSVDAYLEAEERAGMGGYEYYSLFADRVEEVKSRLRKLLGSLREAGKRIAAYGAAAKGTILLNASGIAAPLVEYIVDRNPHKQGLLLPGVRLPIHDPSRLVEDRPDYVVILAWNIADEIMAQQGAYRRAGGRFIVPIPSPTVVESGAASSTPT